MRKKKILPVLLILILTSLGIIFLSQFQKLSFAENSTLQILSPFQRAILGVFSISLGSGNEVDSLEKENASLLKKLTDQAFLESENKALRDQFEKGYPDSSILIPAKVIGRPGFIPGVSEPSYLILDKGRKDSVKKGQAVILNENLVGIILESRDNFSKVQLVSDKDSSFTAKAVSYDDGREVSGIIKGEGLGMVLGNVLLSDTIKIGDIILTKGDVIESGSGFLPNLIVGKITSVEKKSSDLFQKAQVKSSLDFSDLTDVFVIVN